MDTSTGYTILLLDIVPLLKEKVEKRERKYHNTGSNSSFILGVLFRLKFALNGFVRRFHVKIFTIHVNVYKGH